MRLLLILIIIIQFIGVSCKKDKGILNEPSSIIIKKPPVYDTIKPYGYLPVFPGSWWKYIYNNDTIINKTSNIYHLDWYTYYTTFMYRSDTFYVPHYNGRPTWGYRANHGSQVFPYEHPLKLIVSDSLPVGATWQSQKTDSHNGRYSRIKTKDTSITLFGKVYYPTIVVESYSYLDSKNFPVDYWEFYAKNVGLIKSVSGSSMNSGAQKNLVDYFINK